MTRWNTRLKKASEAYKLGKPIWFSRGSFTDPDYRDVATPKWHVFKDRVKVEDKHVYIWVARCGYRHKFWEIIEDVPEMALGRPPAVKDRCTRCTAALRKDERRKKTAPREL
jgi:hypothetical protein